MPTLKFGHFDSLLDGKMAAEFRKKLYVHGYHVYNDIWEVAVGEMLVCMREPRNAHDHGTRNQQEFVCFLPWWPSVERTASA